MKVRLEEGLQLVITPESYVEQVALSKWADTVKGECALLVEAYSQQNVRPTVLCTCETIETHVTKLLDSACPMHGSHSQ